MLVCCRKEMVSESWLGNGNNVLALNLITLVRENC